MDARVIDPSVEEFPLPRFPKPTVAEAKLHRRIYQKERYSEKTNRFIPIPWHWENAMTTCLAATPKLALSKYIVAIDDANKLARDTAMSLDVEATINQIPDPAISDRLHLALANIVEPTEGYSYRFFRSLLRTYTGEDESYDPWLFKLITWSKVKDGIYIPYLPGQKRITQ